MLTVLLGGARSGKSTVAVEIAWRAGEPVTFVATCPRIAGDADLHARIARHRRERPDEWTTIEEEIDLGGALTVVATRLVVVDCLTTWVGNCLVKGMPENEVLRVADAALATIDARALDTVVVTNEVGSGVIPADELSRSYRDVLGRVNQRWVARADRALLMVAGRALVLSDVSEIL